MPGPYSPSEKLREALRGMPESTVEACAEYQATGSGTSLKQAVCRVIEYHLIDPPEKPLETLPGTTALVADLKVDSLAMAEMAFVFDDIFGMKLSLEGLSKVVTLDDLFALIRTETAAAKGTGTA